MSRYHTWERAPTLRRRPSIAVPGPRGPSAFNYLVRTKTVRTILQRVQRAAVRVDDEVVGAIEHGVLLLVGIEQDDTPQDVQVAAAKLVGLRMFEDADGKMNLDIGSVDGQFLVVSQFTLGASLAKGRRPSFNRAAHPDHAAPLVEALMADLRQRGFTVAGGRFGADMQVELINDGPVTFVLDVRQGKVQ